MISLQELLTIATVNGVITHEGLMAILFTYTEQAADNTSIPHAVFVACQAHETGLNLIKMFELDDKANFSLAFEDWADRGFPI